VIGFVSGTVAVRAQDGCIIDVGGIGYRLSCSTTTLASVPAKGVCKLFTHLHVREDALQLFGFATEAERVLFEALLTVSGVGPKVALALCSAFAPDAFRAALARDDADAIASVPGIGKKTAQRVIVDLKEKLAVPDLDIVGQGRDALAQARSALENLGYSAGEVRVALSDLLHSPDDSVEDVVRSALKVLAS
jgi:Holliday junction DNA helicase RuvA